MCLHADFDYCFDLIVTKGGGTKFCLVVLWYFTNVWYELHYDILNRIAVYGSSVL